MIRTLTGFVSDIGNGWIIINVHDVGYLVGCPTATGNFILGGTLTLHTYLAVRETALDLYGFSTKTELEVFELLLTVPKIGPKSALQILNQASPSLLVESINKKDGSYLHKLSGVGKKTCENIVQFLHGKTDRLIGPNNATMPTTDDAQSDAIDALISLGYEAVTAREAILQLPSEGATVNSLVTQALKRIK